MDGRPDRPGSCAGGGWSAATTWRRMGVATAGGRWPGTGSPTRRTGPGCGSGSPHEVARHAAEHPLEPGAPVEALRHRLGLPDRALVEALVRPPLVARGGRISAGGDGVPAELVGGGGPGVRRAGGPPFAAPEAYRLAELGLGARQLAAAVRAGLLVQLGRRRGPAARTRRGRRRRCWPGCRSRSPLSEARQALDTSRRVAVPLLELLDRPGITRRTADDRRVVAAQPPPG